MIQKKIVKERILNPKTSKLKDPQLRKIRKNLRELIILAVNDEIERLSQLEELYYKKYDTRGKLTLSQEKRKKFLDNRISNLEDALTNSICQCANGQSCYSIYLVMGVSKVYFLRKSKKRQSQIKKQAEENKEVEEKLRNGTFWADMDKIWDPVCKKWYCEKCFYLIHPPSQKTGFDK